MNWYGLLGFVVNAICFTIAGIFIGVRYCTRRYQRAVEVIDISGARRR